MLFPVSRYWSESRCGVFEEYCVRPDAFPYQKPPAMPMCPLPFPRYWLVLGASSNSLWSSGVLLLSLDTGSFASSATLSPTIGTGAKQVLAVIYVAAH